MLRAVLFDLDGVLIDSLTAIAAAMNHALVSLARPPIATAAIRQWIGPPLATSAPAILGAEDPGLCERFITLYREHYRAHAAATTAAIPGLTTIIPLLATRWPLAVATSKPEAFARPLLEHLGVAAEFRAICGGALDHHRDTKATIIAAALAALDLADGSGVVMVGDRSYDVVGAAAHGIPTIGATYGMGGAAELREAGARWLIDELAELPPLLEGLDPTGL